MRGQATVCRRRRKRRGPCGDVEVYQNGIEYCYGIIERDFGICVGARRALTKPARWCVDGAGWTCFARIRVAVVRNRNIVRSPFDQDPTPRPTMARTSRDADKPDRSRRRSQTSGSRPDCGRPGRETTGREKPGRDKPGRDKPGQPGDRGDGRSGSARDKEGLGGAAAGEGPPARPRPRRRPRSDHGGRDGGGKAERGRTAAVRSAAAGGSPVAAADNPEAAAGRRSRGRSVGCVRHRRRAGGRSPGRSPTGSTGGAGSAGPAVC